MNGDHAKWSANRSNFPRFLEATMNTRDSTHPDLGRNLTNGVIHSFASRGNHTGTVLRLVHPSLFLVPTLFLLFLSSVSLAPITDGSHILCDWLGEICRCLICGPLQCVVHLCRGSHGYPFSKRIQLISADQTKWRRSSGPRHACFSPVDGYSVTCTRT